MLLDKAQYIAVDERNFEPLVGAPLKDQGMIETDSKIAITTIMERLFAQRAIAYRVQ